MENYIKKVKITGLFNRVDIEQDFQAGINIIYGENGEFKTTFLHVITNLLNKDFGKFFNLQFNTVEVHLANGSFYKLNWENEDKDRLEIRRNNSRRSAIISREGEPIITDDIVVPEVAYFPTFRSIIEAWFAHESLNSVDPKSISKEIKKDISEFLREIFGGFVPNINFLSLPEIITRLNEKIFEAGTIAIQKDQVLISEMISGISDIVIFPDLNKDLDDLILDEENPSVDDLETISNRINSILKKIYARPIGPYLGLPKAVDKKLNSIDLEKYRSDGIGFYGETVKLLNIYEKSLETQVHELDNLFLKFEIYLNSLNDFLREKMVLIKSEEFDYFKPFLELQYSNKDIVSSSKYSLDEIRDASSNDSDILNKFKGLSSGERQIATLLYAAHISSQEVVLIDEPEISLHTIWQETLLSELQKQLGDKQIIVCTHSPSIGADYLDSVECMNISATSENNLNNCEEEAENESRNSSQRSKDEENEEPYRQQEYHEDEGYEVPNSLNKFIYES